MSFDQRQPRPRKNRRGTKFIASGSVVRPGGPLSGARTCRSLGHFAGGAEGVSRASRRAVRFRSPRSSIMPGAGGRTGAGQPIHTRRVQGTRPGSTVWEAGIVARSALQGPHTPQKPPKSCLVGTSERRGRGGRNPATKAPSGGYLAPQTNTLSVRIQQGLAYLGALVTARRDVGTPAGVERGGNAEASYA